MELPLPELELNCKAELTTALPNGRTILESCSLVSCSTLDTRHSRRKSGSLRKKSPKKNNKVAV